MSSTVSTTSLTYLVEPIPPSKPFKGCLVRKEPPKVIYIQYRTPRRRPIVTAKSIGSGCTGIGTGCASLSTTKRTCHAPDNTPTSPSLPERSKEDNNKERSGQKSRRHKALFHRHFLTLLLSATIALAAGKLLDGEPSNSNDAKNNGKQRGQSLPSASSKQEGIAKEMFNVYQAMKQDYHTKTFGANQKQWKVINERNGAKVSLLEHASDPTCPYVRMETIIPASVGSCWEFLSIHNWHWSMPKMDPFYDTHSVFSNYTHQGVNMVLVQKKTHRILAFGKRDFVFLSVSDQALADGTHVSGSVSVETPDVPRSRHYTRAFQDSIAFYKPVIHDTTGEEQCHLTIVCRIDLNDSGESGSGGFVPMWLYVKTVGATGIKSILKMKDALMEMKQGQADRASKVPTAAWPTAMPPTPSPTAIHRDQPTVAAGNGNKVNTKKSMWWDRARGGAFVTPPPTTAKVTVEEKWKPFYHIFTHFPPVKGRKPLKGWGLFSVKWLQNIPRPRFGSRRHSP